MKAIFRYINAKNLFDEYAPNITSRYQKMSGKGPFGKEMKFTEEEKQIILNAIHQMAKDLISTYKKSKIDDIYSVGNQKIQKKISEHKKNNP